MNTYPAIIKDLLAIWVRCKETLAARFIDHFILAEKCYSSELPFIQNRYTIVENKAEQPVETYKKIQSHKSPKIVILFTGTIASSTGIFECIETIKNLHALDTKITLKIVGYCPDKSTQKKVELLINNRSYEKIY